MSPIRLRHAVVPLLAMPAGGKFQLAFAVAAGYDPSEVAAWRVELAARYGANRTPWVGSVVTVSGQDFSFDYDPTEASDDDEDVTLADVAEAGNCAWSVTALDGDDLPLWRVQGDVDFVEGVGDPDTGNGSGAGNPILIRVDEGDTITLSISTGEAGADGAAVEMQASETHIQYRLVGSESWINVIALSEIEGAQGPQGIQGMQGQAGTNGTNGVRGSKWYQGSGAPTTDLGGLLAGDFYFRTTDFTVHEYSGTAWSQIATITATIPDASVTNAKLANMAAGTVKGRAVGAGTGAPVDLSDAQQKALFEAAVASGGTVTVQATGTGNGIILHPDSTGAVQIKGSGTGMSASGILEFLDSAGTRIGYIYQEATSGKMVMMNQRNGPLVYGQNSADRLTVYGSGGVHIGNSPSDPGANALRVQGNLKTGAELGWTNGNFFYVEGGGIVAFRCASNPGRFQFQGAGAGPATDHGFEWRSGSCSLVTNGAAILEQKSGTTAQKFRVYGTTTGSRYVQLEHDGTDAILSSTSGMLRASTPFTVPTYTVATVPAASTYLRALIYVSDESGGAVIAFSDGTNWLRVTDRSIIS